MEVLKRGHIEEAGGWGVSITRNAGISGHKYFLGRLYNEVVSQVFSSPNWVGH